MRRYSPEQLGQALWNVLWYLSLAEELNLNQVTLPVAQVSILLDYIDGKHIPPIS